jgi:hypothetical protein
VIANVVTVRSPFSEDKSEQALLMSLRQKKPVYAKANVLPGCPQKLLELIDRCTHYDATMRPSMTDVERELRMVLQSIQSQDGFGLPALWQERGFLLNSPEQLLECSAGSRDYDLIKARLEQEMGNSPTVLKVEMNANVDLLRRYALERKKSSRRERRGRQRGVAVACNVQQCRGEVHLKRRLRPQQARARFRVLWRGHLPGPGLQVE